jgi:hypothetical protein
MTLDEAWDEYMGVEKAQREFLSAWDELWDVVRTLAWCALAGIVLWLLILFSFGMQAAVINNHINLAR